MAACRFFPEAVADLEAIGDYIAADDPRRAVTFRMFPVQKYLIFYQLADDGIEIVRILRASRDVEALL